MKILSLLLGFLRVGCFSFGGAYGAIPLIRDVVLSHGWLTDEALTYMIAVSESTPGPIMVNIATFVGSDQAGIPGAAAATAAVVLPSFLIILLISALSGALLKNRYVQAGLKGMTPCIIGIILFTGAELILRTCTAPEADLRDILLTAGLACILFLPRLIRRKDGKQRPPMSPILLILIAAAAGVVLFGM